MSSNCCMTPTLLQLMSLDAAVTLMWLDSVGGDSLTLPEPKWDKLDEKPVWGEQTMSSDESECEDGSLIFSQFLPPQPYLH